MPEVPQILLDAWHDCPVYKTQEYEYVVNPLTDQAPPCPPELLEAAGTWMQQQFTDADVILGEEDRGGILASYLATLTRTSFVLAKWYPSKLSTEYETQMKNGYREGELYLNGIQKGDRVTIVDDLVSTGSTVIALIEAVQDMGATVNDVIVLCEKPDVGGRRVVQEKTGVPVTSGFQVVVESGRSRVVGYDH